jgi:hypothetical protein
MAWYRQDPRNIRNREMEKTLMATASKMVPRA